MLLAFERDAAHCLRKAPITILTGFLHDLPMAAAAATGRQIMQGIKAHRALFRICRTRRQMQIESIGD